MSDKELRDFERNARAAIAGFFAAFVLGGIAAWAAERHTANAVPAALVFGLILGILGGIVSLAGARCLSSGTATVLGAILLVVLANLLCLPLPMRKVFEVLMSCEYYWFLAAAASIGALCGQVGKIAARSVSKADDEPPRLQFSLMELLMAFIPVAIFLGYVRYLMQR